MAFQQREIILYDNITTELTDVLNIVSNQVNRKLILVPSQDMKDLAIMIANQHRIDIAKYNPGYIAKHPYIRFSSLLLKACVTPWDNQLKENIASIFSIDVQEISKLHNTIITITDTGKIFVELLDNLSDFCSKSLEQFHVSNTDSQYDDIAMSIIKKLTDISYKGGVSNALSLLERTLREINIDNQDESLVEIIVMSEITEKLTGEFRICAITNKTQLEQIVSLTSDKNIFTITSHKFDLLGEENLLPYWAEPIEAHPSYNFLENKEINSNKTDFLNKMISKDMNNVNSLCLEKPGSSLSPTGIELFCKCPSQFFYQRILRIQDKVKRNDIYDYAREYGTFVHACLEDIVKDNTYDDIDNVIADNSWRLDDIKIKAYIDEYIARARFIIDHFVQYEKEHPTTKIEVETTVKGNLDIGDQKVEISGKIDRIHKQGNSTYVVDYKTGMKPDTQDPFMYGRRIQLALYALLLDKKIEAIEYWHIRNEGIDIDSITWTKENEQRAKDIAQSVGAMFKEGIFIPRTEITETTTSGTTNISPCDTCAYELICTNESRELYKKHKDQETIYQYDKVTTFF